jgi:hypothetical protein
MNGLPTEIIGNIARFIPDIYTLTEFKQTSKKIYNAVVSDEYNLSNELSIKRHGIDFTNTKSITKLHRFISSCFASFKSITDFDILYHLYEINPNRCDILYGITLIEHIIKVDYIQYCLHYETMFRHPSLDITQFSRRTILRLLRQMFCMRAINSPFFIHNYDISYLMKNAVTRNMNYYEYMSIIDDLVHIDIISTVYLLCEMLDTTHPFHNNIHQCYVVSKIIRSVLRYFNEPFQLLGVYLPLLQFITETDLFIVQNFNQFACSPHFLVSISNPNRRLQDILFVIIRKNEIEFTDQHIQDAIMNNYDKDIILCIKSKCKTITPYFEHLVNNYLEKCIE